MYGANYRDPSDLTHSVFQFTRLSYVRYAMEKEKNSNNQRNSENDFTDFDEK